MKKIMQLLMTVLLTIGSASVCAMHFEGDLGGSFTPRIRSDAEPHKQPPREQPRAGGDSAYQTGGRPSPAQHGGTPSSQGLTQDDSPPGSRLPISIAGDQDITDSGISSAPGTTGGPQLIISKEDAGAILRVAKGQSHPHFLVHPNGTLLRNPQADFSPMGFSHADEDFYENVRRKIQEQRAQYATQSLTVDQQQVEQAYVEAVNGALLHLRQLQETSLSSADEISQEREKILALVDQMNKAVTGIPAVDEHQLAEGLPADGAGDRSQDVDTALEEILAREAGEEDDGQGERSPTPAAPADPDRAAPAESTVFPDTPEAKVVTKNEETINGFLIDMRLNPADLANPQKRNWGFTSMRDVRTGLRLIKDIKDQAQARGTTGGKLTPGELDSIKIVQESVIAQLQVMFAKFLKRDLFKTTAKELDGMEKKITAKKKLLKGKPTALKDFSARTDQLMRNIQTQLRALNKVSPNDYAEFTQSYLQRHTELNALLQLLGDLIDGVKIQHLSDTAPLVPTNQPKGLQSPADFFKNGEGALLLKKQFDESFKTTPDVARTDAETVVQQVLEDDQAFQDAFAQLQKLKDQQQQKLKGVGDLFASDTPADKKLKKQIAAQMAAIEARLAAVIKQELRVQKMLKATTPPQSAGQVLLELGKQQRSWKARVSSATRDDLALAIALTHKVADLQDSRGLAESPAELAPAEPQKKPQDEGVTAQEPARSGPSERELYAQQQREITDAVTQFFARGQAGRTGVRSKINDQFPGTFPAVKDAAEEAVIEVLTHDVPFRGLFSDYQKAEGAPKAPAQKLLFARRDFVIKQCVELVKLIEATDKGTPGVDVLEQVKIQLRDTLSSARKGARDTLQLQYFLVIDLQAAQKAATESIQAQVLTPAISLARDLGSIPLAELQERAQKLDNMLFAAEDSLALTQDAQAKRQAVVTRFKGLQEVLKHAIRDKMKAEAQPVVAQLDQLYDAQAFEQRQGLLTDRKASPQQLQAAIQDTQAAIRALEQFTIPQQFRLIDGARNDHIAALKKKEQALQERLNPTVKPAESVPLPRPAEQDKQQQESDDDAEPVEEGPVDQLAREKREQAVADFLGSQDGSAMIQQQLQKFFSQPGSDRDNAQIVLTRLLKSDPQFAVLLGRKSQANSNAALAKWNASVEGYCADILKREQQVMQAIAKMKAPRGIAESEFDPLMQLRTQLEREQRGPLARVSSGVRAAKDWAIRIVDELQQIRIEQVGKIPSVMDITQLSHRLTAIVRDAAMHRELSMADHDALLGKVDGMVSQLEMIQPVTPDVAVRREVAVQLLKALKDALEREEVFKGLTQQQNALLERVYTSDPTEDFENRGELLLSDAPTPAELGEGLAQIQAALEEVRGVVIPADKKFTVVESEKQKRIEMLEQQKAFFENRLQPSRDDEELK